MFAELDSAYQRKAPIMLWIYSPHWAPAKYEGEWVEFPEYTPECYTDPKWGINPDKAYDCGKPHGEIWKYSWAGMKDKWPVAYKVAKAYQIDADELNKLSRRGRPRRQDDRRRRGRMGRRQRGQVEGLGAVDRRESRPVGLAAGRRHCPTSTNRACTDCCMTRCDAARRDAQAVKLACRNLWKVFGAGAAEFMASRSGKASVRRSRRRPS